ncbi:MAG: GNAT family N-acetyltransferase [Rhodocyclaceae bacterium]
MSRLSMHVLTLADAERVQAYYLRNRRHLAASSPRRDDDWFALPACQLRIAQQLLDQAAGTAVHWLVCLAGQAEVIGHVSLTGILRGPFQAGYLGYGIDHAHCGQGLATEALQRVAGHAFGEMNLHRLMANHVPENQASARVLAKLGFVTEGTARDYLRLDGVWRDHVLTALSNPDWREA